MFRPPAERLGHRQQDINSACLGNASGGLLGAALGRHRGEWEVLYPTSGRGWGTSREGGRESRCSGSSWGPEGAPRMARLCIRGEGHPEGARPRPSDQHGGRSTVNLRRNAGVGEVGGRGRVLFARLGAGACERAVDGSLRDWLPAYQGGGRCFRREPSCTAPREEEVGPCRGSRREPRPWPLFS